MAIITGRNIPLQRILLIDMVNCKSLKIGTAKEQSQNKREACCEQIISACMYTVILHGYTMTAYI